MLISLFSAVSGPVIYVRTCKINEKRQSITKRSSGAGRQITQFSLFSCSYIDIWSRQTVAHRRVPSRLGYNLIDFVKVQALQAVIVPRDDLVARLQMADGVRKAAPFDSGYKCGVPALMRPLSADDLAKKKALWPLCFISFTTYRLYKIYMMYTWNTCISYGTLCISESLLSSSLVPHSSCI